MISTECADTSALVIKTHVNLDVTEVSGLDLTPCATCTLPAGQPDVWMVPKGHQQIKTPDLIFPSSRVTDFITLKETDLGTIQNVRT